MTEVTVLWEAECQLGEGPAWFAAERMLRFVDIKRGRIFSFDPASGARETHEVGGQPSFIVARKSGGAIFGSDLSLYEFASGKRGRTIMAIPDTDGNRTNDATVDSAGRLWFGTMDDHHLGRMGAVWCLDGTGLHRAGAEATITNGPAISPDGRWLYHVDTAKRLIWRFPFDGRPQLAGGQVIVELRDSEGAPDGVVVDAEGCIWLGLWAGWGVRRYAPDGSLMRHIAMPCANVTKIAFGGDDLGTAFVTTARIGLTAGQLAEQPLAGALLAFDPGVAGLPLPAVSA